MIWWFVSFENLGWSTQFFQMPLWFSQTECTFVSQSWKLFMMFLCGCQVVKALSSNLYQWSWVTSLHCLFCPTPPSPRRDQETEGSITVITLNRFFMVQTHTYWHTYAKRINPDAGSLREHSLSVKLNVKTWTNFVATITVQRSSYTVEQSLENFLKHKRNKFLWRRKHYRSTKILSPL